MDREKEKWGISVEILITTDVYSPTVNGVVISIINLKQELTLRCREVHKDFG